MTAILLSEWTKLRSLRSTAYTLLARSRRPISDSGGDGESGAAVEEREYAETKW